MSTTYISAVVGVLAILFRLSGTDFDTEAATKVISDFVSLAVLVWIVIRRFQNGDVKWFGVRK